MISLNNVTFTYSKNTEPIFNRLNLMIEENSWVLVTGPDGAGKTTLCKMIKGLIHPDSGSVTLACPGGHQSVGYLSGDPYDSFVGITVSEDITFGMENLGVPRSEMSERLEKVLKWTNLEGMEDRLVHTLSGGEQQKVALAGILAMGSQVLVLDDAFNMLDQPNKKTLRSLINDLRLKHNLTVVETGHILEPEIQRVIFLSQGKILIDSPTSDLALHKECLKWTAREGSTAGLIKAVAMESGVDLDTFIIIKK